MLSLSPARKWDSMVEPIENGEAARYWAAYAAGDSETARAIARAMAERLRQQADEAELTGKRVLPESLRYEAADIERGVIAPYPRPGGLQGVAEPMRRSHRGSPTGKRQPSHERGSG